LERLFCCIGFTKLDTVIVSQPKYMKALQTLQKIMFCMERIYEVDFIKQLNWFIVYTVDAANFDFYGKTLTGAIKQRP
jgi:endothelin-converting enzyme/putative endopeptidase